ncbi:ABC transporter permease [Mycobacteroides abscessus subsp. abscessus]|uniref:MlaE family ABC transporter permease n=1 Tax=Mycobacteroides abscessus TaxID=36809 RepID=UPI003CF86CB3
MTASTYVPPIARPFVGIYNRVQKPVTRLGHMVAFFFRAIAGVPIVLRHYWKEFLRHLSDIAWGNGSLVVGGGTAGVMIVLGVIAGGLVAIEGYNFLDLLGLGPATGIISSLVNTRELAPIMAAIVVTIPLYVACLAVSYLSCQVMVGIMSGGSIGSYLHYFGIGVSGIDIVYSVIKAIIFVWIASTIQCYYGFYASGGPEGVGVAAGHAMRAAITLVIIINMLLTMALWSVDAGARLGG